MGRLVDYAFFVPCIFIAIDIAETALICFIRYCSNAFIFVVFFLCIYAERYLFAIAVIVHVLILYRYIYISCCRMSPV